MLRKGIALLIVASVVLVSSIGFSSCKSCKKDSEATVTHTDSVSAPAVSHNPINLPHADSALAPVLAKVMDAVFEASKKKDYATLASYLVYRGPDLKRMGYETFNVKNAYERGVVRITGEVFNKWNSSSETKDYARIFSLPQPEGKDMVVLEVIFVSRKEVDQKFFGFLQLNNDEYKIVDVTSNLGVQ